MMTETEGMPSTATAGAAPQRALRILVGSGQDGHSAAAALGEVLGLAASAISVVTDFKAALVAPKDMPVVVIRRPDAAVAGLAMALGATPTEAVAAWTEETTALVTFARRHPRRVTLVDQRALQMRADGLQGALAARLGISVATDPAQDPDRATTPARPAPDQVQAVLNAVAQAALAQDAEAQALAAKADALTLGAEAGAPSLDLITAAWQLAQDMQAQATTAAAMDRDLKAEPAKAQTRADHLARQLEAGGHAPAEAAPQSWPDPDLREAILANQYLRLAAAHDQLQERLAQAEALNATLTATGAALPDENQGVAPQAASRQDPAEAETAPAPVDTAALRALEAERTLLIDQIGQMQGLLEKSDATGASYRQTLHEAEAKIAALNSELAEAGSGAAVQKELAAARAVDAAERQLLIDQIGQMHALLEKSDATGAAYRQTLHEAQAKTAAVQADLAAARLAAAEQLEQALARDAFEEERQLLIDQMAQMRQVLEAADAKATATTQVLQDAREQAAAEQSRLSDQIAQAHQALAQSEAKAADLARQLAEAKAAPVGEPEQSSHQAERDAILGGLILRLISEQEALRTQIVQLQAELAEAEQNAVTPDVALSHLSPDTDGTRDPAV